MIPDSGAFLDILKARVAAMRDAPWPIPALVLLRFTDEDLDRLEAVADTPRYWSVLNEIVVRIESEAE